MGVISASPLQVMFEEAALPRLNTARQCCNLGWMSPPQLCIDRIHEEDFRGQRWSPQVNIRQM